MGDTDLGEMNRFLTDLNANLGEVADIDVESLHSGIVLAEASPRNRDALGMSWIVMADEVIFQAGNLGGRWELSNSVEGAAWMERVAHAVAHGRVRETFGLNRSRVVVTFEDGTTVTETGYSTFAGLLPIPGWKRRGRTVKYPSYFD